jgi:hypothetical protein
MVFYAIDILPHIILLFFDFYHNNFAYTYKFCIKL